MYSLVILRGNKTSSVLELMMGSYLIRFHAPPYTLDTKKLQNKIPQLFSIPYFRKAERKSSTRSSASSSPTEIRTSPSSIPSSSLRSRGIEA